MAKKYPVYRYGVEMNESADGSTVSHLIEADNFYITEEGCLHFKIWDEQANENVFVAIFAPNAWKAAYRNSQQVDIASGNHNVIF